MANTHGLVVAEDVPIHTLAAQVLSLAACSKRINQRICALKDFKLPPNLIPWFGWWEVKMRWVM